MVLGICGYGYTGSGAVLDLLKEYDCISVVEDGQEFALAYFPDGIEDLEFHLVEQPSRFFSSDIALMRFLKLTKKMSKNKHIIYNKTTKGYFGQYSREYIDGLIQITWRGHWMIEPYINDNIIDATKRKILRHIIPKKSGFSKYALRSMRFSIKPEDFMTYTNAYLKKIAGINEKSSKIWVLNQAFPANMPLRSMRYYGNDTKAIIVDRDPRDLYILCKKFIKPKWIPVEDVKDFIIYYKGLHQSVVDNPNVIYLQFEKLIYDYENTIRFLEETIGIENLNHTNPKSFFDPDISRNNTQLFLKNPEFANDIEEINIQLKNYLYEFPVNNDKETISKKVF